MKRQSLHFSPLFEHVDFELNLSHPLTGRRFPHIIVRMWFQWLNWNFFPFQASAAAQLKSSCRKGSSARKVWSYSQNAISLKFNSQIFSLLYSFSCWRNGNYKSGPDPPKLTLTLCVFGQFVGKQQQRHSGKNSWSICTLIPWFTWINHDPCDASMVSHSQ